MAAQALADALRTKSRLLIHCQVLSPVLSSYAHRVPFPVHCETRREGKKTAGKTQFLRDLYLERALLSLISPRPDMGLCGTRQASLAA
eukprot:1003933-Rhodomonas_salina.1